MCMLFDAMYTFVIVTMRLCEAKRCVADLSTPPLRTPIRMDLQQTARLSLYRFDPAHLYLKWLHSTHWLCIWVSL